MGFVDQITRKTFGEKNDLQEAENGVWKEYPKGSVPWYLSHDLAGHNTNWCMANLISSRRHLDDGDVYVYFTADDDKKFTIP